MIVKLILTIIDKSVFLWFMIKFIPTLIWYTTKNSKMGEFYPFLLCISFGILCSNDTNEALLIGFAQNCFGKSDYKCKLLTLLVNVRFICSTTLLCWGVPDISISIQVSWYNFLNLLPILNILIFNPVSFFIMTFQILKVSNTFDLYFIR